jgi:hypothetical protein
LIFFAPDFEGFVSLVEVPGIGALAAAPMRLVAHLVANIVALDTVELLTAVRVLVFGICTLDISCGRDALDLL